MSRTIEICQLLGRDGDVCDCLACRLRRCIFQLEEQRQWSEQLADRLREMTAAAGAACTVLARHDLTEEFIEKAESRGVRPGFGVRAQKTLDEYRKQQKG